MIDGCANKAADALTAGAIGSSGNGRQPANDSKSLAPAKLRRMPRKLANPQPRRYDIRAAAHLVAEAPPSRSRYNSCQVTSRRVAPAGRSARDSSRSRRALRIRRASTTKA